MSIAETQGFRDAEKYANYLKTASGRLRSDLAWENLRRPLPEPARTGRVLDLGGGTGCMSIRLAKLEFQPVLLDSSEEMLQITRMDADANGVATRISFCHADAGQLQELFEAESFGLAICHNVLEFVANPGAVIQSVSRVLRKDGVFSILVRNRAGEVLKTAINSTEWELAKENLSAQTAMDSLYGKPVRLFDPVDIVRMLAEANLCVTGQYGVRVFSDYLDSPDPDSEAYRKIFDLEFTLGARPPFAAIARYIQFIARHSSSTPVLDR